MNRRGFLAAIAASWLVPRWFKATPAPAPQKQLMVLVRPGLHSLAYMRAQLERANRLDQVRRFAP